MQIILTPPVALLAYIVLVALLYSFGRLMAPAARRRNVQRASLYASGEIASTGKAAPGYRRFFIVALFFAVLHLGALVLGTAGLTGGLVAGSALWVALLFYLGGLAMTMLILLVS